MSLDIEMCRLCMHHAKKTVESKMKKESTREFNIQCSCVSRKQRTSGYGSEEYDFFSSNY